MVRVLFDDAAYSPRRCELFCLAVEVQDNGCSRRIALSRVDAKLIFPSGFPASRCFLTDFSRNYLYAVSNNKGRIKANTKLPNELAVFLLITTELIHKGRGT